jgi:hypothetical protein
MLESVKAKLSSSKNIIISSFIVVLLVMGIGVGVFLVGQRQIFKEKASVSNVDLTMIPASTSVTPGQTFTIAISVNPNGNSVSAGNVIVSYPASGLTLESVDPGPFFMKNFNATGTEMLNKIDKSTPGKATIILGAPCTVQAPWVCYPNSSTDNYAILHFKALNASTNAVTFDPGTQMAAVGKTTNVLGDTTASQVIVRAPTIAPTTSPTTSPTTPASPPSGTAGLSFKVKFQGINSQKAAQKVKVTLKGGQTFADIDVAADSGGVYSGVVTGITPGTYAVLVKGPKQLQKNLGNVTFVANQTVTQNWSGIELPAGDVDGNGTINSVDIGMLIQDYAPNTPANSPADFDLDGTVNTVDIGMMLDNYYKNDEQ